MLACTFTRHVTVLQGWATDGRIEQCNIEAAHLYGFETEEELKGQYLSSLRPESESVKARRRITAWWAGKKDINDESTQLIRRRNGEIVACHKKVSQTIVDEYGRAGWHTTLKLCSQHQHVEETWSTPGDCLVSEDDVIKVCGHYTYASLQNALTTLTPLYTILPQNLRTDKRADCRGISFRWAWRNRDYEKHFYSCSRCGFSWFGKEKKPRFCGNRESCGTEFWD